ncbi:MAG: phosphoribosylformylglycinamidine synthase subunit PurS [Candidatus Bathyarchaeia archaeon]|nr:phosphoribosylformylglycinamidine synthase subunit PurS [Candidatus Bathyarchaeota archaeon]
MIYIVRVGYKNENFDPLGRILKSDILDLGFSNLENIRSMPTYWIESETLNIDIEKICKELLIDEIIQDYWINEEKNEWCKGFNWIVEVNFKPGVTDPVADSVKKGIETIGVFNVKNVKTGMTYLLKGNLSEDDVKIICNKCLANPIIHNYKIIKIMKY